MVRLVTSIVVVTIAGADFSSSSRTIEFDVVSIKLNTSDCRQQRADAARRHHHQHQPDHPVHGHGSVARAGARGGRPAGLGDERARPDHRRVGLRVDTRTACLDVEALYADRMKLRAHVETREQDTYALVLARSDGRLGPQLKPSALDCSPRPPGSPLPTPPTFSS